MVSRKVTVKNPSGLHLRPAGNLCRMAIRYNCRVEFRCRGGDGQRKSVLSVLEPALNAEMRLRSSVKGRMRNRRSGKLRRPLKKGWEKGASTAYEETDRTALEIRDRGRLYVR